METEQNISKELPKSRVFPSLVELTQEEEMILDFLKENAGVYIEQVREHLLEKNLARTSAYVYFTVRGLVKSGFIRKEERSRGNVYYLKNKDWLINQK